MSLKQIIPFFIGFFLLAACSGGSGGREVKAYVSAYLKGNEKVVSFGSVDYQSILDKAEYKSIPKLGKILENEVKRLGRSIDTKAPVYFVIEGPFDQNGNPAASYAFINVVNKDSLADRLGASGLFVEESGDMKFAINGDVAIGAMDDLAIVITKKEKYNGKEMLTAAFEKAKGDAAGGKLDKLLGKKGDITFNVNIQNLYNTSNTDLSKLDENKQKELASMVKDSYIHSAISFEKGQAVYTAENMFSDALKQRMFFKEDKQAKILEKLGTGKARAGVSANIDVLKIETFMDDFAPDVKKQLLNMKSEIAFAAMMLGDKPFTKVFGGTFGLLVVGEPKMSDGFIPDVNFNVGIGSSGKMLFEMLASQAGNGRFVYKVTDTDLIGKSPNAGAGMSTLEIPECGKEFGKQGLTAFLNFEGFDVESFGFRGGLKTLNIIENVALNVNNDGAKVIVRAKDPNKNILKQLVDLYVRDIEMQINNMAI